MNSISTNYFRRIRKRLRLSQFDVAIRIGVTTGAVSGWERGQVPSLKLVDKFCEVYGVKRDEVLRAMADMAKPAPASA